MKDLVCPISNEQINERLTRLNAFFTVVLVVAGFAFHSVFFLVFLLADFYIRAFTKLKFSPLSFTSSMFINAFGLQEKSISKAPKIFAARLGFLMTLVISTLFLLNLNFAAIIVAGVLIFLASLEFALGICVGCIIYTYFVLPFYKK